ncbi:MAG TPA: excinuclease ABC subunit UvrC [Verrucomicrobiae bacterium]|nr:excinuclease ABC subunit UvrC [Verrucomicrobiae bacterium]
MSKVLSEKIKELPKRSGVYIFKDSSGMVLYVGKAVRLRDRVSSYFKDDDKRDTRIQLMIGQIADFDYVVTDNEVESLVLENNFIKQLKPKYNVRLRDDKNYLFIKINLQDEIPTIEYDRKPTDRKAKYFGPYTSALSIKETLRMIRRIFPYCANDKVGTKPCFFYHIQKCPGVCIGKISPEEYRKHTIDKIISFLEGRQIEVLKELQGQMKYLAAHKQYERAARVRDQIFALNRVLERQKLVYTSKVSQDVFSLYMDGVSSINLFIIREGKLTQKENFILENTKQSEGSEIMESFLTRYYLESSNLPKEIMLPGKINETELNKLFLEKIGRKPKFIVPTRGPKLQLLKLGTENAKQYLESQSDKHLLEEARLMSSLKELQRVLNLESLPARIEAFDISNIQGTNAVGSMIVFDFGKPQKAEYRKFKINIKDTPDDFAMMKEMLLRRFKHLPGSSEEKVWAKPDLILIDGGKGQLSTAVSVLKTYNLQIPIIGLAKRLEEIFLPRQSTPIILPKSSIALFLLQRIRDEAHRFAITYHRKLRSRGAIRSLLDQIQGIGPAKKRMLLEKFGSPQKIREASLTEISEVIGSKLAEKLKASI